MPGWIPYVLAGLLLVAVVIQLAIPRVAARQICDQLTSLGGEAEVTITAWPAYKLVRREGDTLIVEGRGLEIGMSREGGGLSALDGFERVTIVLEDFATGPFDVETFELARVGDAPYRMLARARTSSADLLEYGGAQMNITGAPLLGSIVRSASISERAFSVSVEVELTSEDGLLAVSGGGGSIGGYPAGPIASMIAAAVARRLELDF